MSEHKHSEVVVANGILTYIQENKAYADKQEDSAYKDKQELQKYLKIKLENGT